MNELMQNDVYDEFVEQCLLYGLAYMNEKNMVELEKWIPQLTLPTLLDLEAEYGLDKATTR